MVILALGWERLREEDVEVWRPVRKKSGDGPVWEAVRKSQIWDVLKVETAGLADEQTEGMRGKEAVSIAPSKPLEQLTGGMELPILKGRKDQEERSGTGG